MMIIKIIAIAHFKKTCPPPRFYVNNRDSDIINMYSYYQYFNFNFSNNIFNVCFLLCRLQHYWKERKDWLLSSYLTPAKRIPLRRLRQPQVVQQVMQLQKIVGMLPHLNQIPLSLLHHLLGLLHPYLVMNYTFNVILFISFANYLVLLCSS